MKSMCKLALALLFFSILFSHLLGTDCRADLKVYPALTLSEIYDDNILNAEKDKVSDFITRLMPSLSFDYQGSRITMNLAYTLDYRLYAKGEQDDETVHFLDTVSLLNWKDRYFLELTRSALPGLPEHVPGLPGAKPVPEPDRSEHPLAQPLRSVQPVAAQLAEDRLPVCPDHLQRR